MCSNNQPKMFAAADPLQTSGTFAPATVNAGNPQPTSANTPALPVPIAPSTPSNGLPSPIAKKTISAPTGFKQPSLPGNSGGPMRFRW